MTLELLKDAWRVFQVGQQVADPAKWKAHQVQANQLVMLLAAIAALAKVAGVDLHLDDQTIGLLAGGLLGAVNWAVTLATSAKVGLGPMGGTVRADPVDAVPVAGPAGDRAAGGQPHAAASVGSEPAVASAPVAVRPQPGAADNPDPYLPG